MENTAPSGDVNLGKRPKPPTLPDSGPRHTDCMGSCMFEEQRIAPRERLSLPLKLRDGSQALTRDISATGLFFEMEGEHLLSGLVDFEMQLPEARMKFIVDWRDRPPRAFARPDRRSRPAAGSSAGADRMKR